MRLEYKGQELKEGIYYVREPITLGPREYLVGKGINKTVLSFQPNNLTSNHYNPVIGALISLDLALLACRLFNTNALPIAGIMLSKESKEERE